LRKKQNPEVSIMKLVQSLIVAAVLAVPAVSSFAQSNQAVSRAEVKAQLVQLEKAGYNPASDRTQYPNNIEAAQARVNVENGTASGYGGVADVGSASGASVHNTVSASDLRSMYGRS
jgi:hypothetical protein